MNKNTIKEIRVTTNFSANSKAGILLAIPLAHQTPCKLICCSINTPIAENVSTQLDCKEDLNRQQKNKLTEVISKIYKETDKPSGKIDWVIADKSNAVFRKNKAVT